MTPPHHPLDEDLRAFVDDEDEKELQRARARRPPPSALHAAREQVVGRFREKTPSGIHNVEELQRLLEDKIAADNAEKLLALKRRADEAEAEISGGTKRPSRTPRRRRRRASRGCSTC